MLPSNASDIMTRDVVTIRKGASVDEALKLMAKHKVSGIPVVDVDGKLEGIITERDLLLKGQIPASPIEKRLAGRLPTPRAVVEDLYDRAQGDTVEEAMTTKVISFSEDSAVTDIARVMVENNVNRVPICRDGVVVGLVSRSDIVRAMARYVQGPAKPKAKKERKIIEL